MTCPWPIVLAALAAIGWTVRWNGEIARPTCTAGSIARVLTNCRIEKGPPGWAGGPLSSSYWL